MAARINRKHSEDIRKKIQASVIVDRFKRCHMGELELTDMQYKTGLALLERSVPKMAQIQGPGDDGEHEINLKVSWVQSRSL